MWIKAIPAIPQPNAAQTCGIRLQVIKHPEAERSFVLLPRRWVVERSFGWLGHVFGSWRVTMNACHAPSRDCTFWCSSACAAAQGARRIGGRGFITGSGERGVEMNASSETIESRQWDYVIVGAGVGGATIGHALAKAGHSVLFCERGRDNHSIKGALYGKFAEEFFDSPSIPEIRHQNILDQAGRWSALIADRSVDHVREHIPFLGGGTGGSSALYGMVMERFHPSDLTPARNHPSFSCKQHVPDEWPIKWNELESFYSAAEDLYRVHGEIGSFSDKKNALREIPVPLTPAGAELWAHLSKRGLCPYRLPLACDWVHGCTGCQGFLCDKQCKNDSARVCLVPSLRQYDAHLLSNCEVSGLGMSGSHVSDVFASCKGRDFKIKARRVILAAGALVSPTILLRSRDDRFPNGIGNRHDLVGRYLMRHCVDLFAVFLRSSPSKDTNLKEIGCTDCYQVDGQRLGSIQSFGKLPPGKVLAAQIRHDLKVGKLGETAARIFSFAEPVVALLLEWIFNRSLILASTLEDLPRFDNRVLPTDVGAPLNFRYILGDYEKARIYKFRRTIRKLLYPYPVLTIAQAENNDRLAHVCGTCRFGTDPKTSVLDRYNRVHDVENLFVTDASFFPSSAAINPALTIAANALRVADHLLITESKKV